MKYNRITYPNGQTYQYPNESEHYVELLFGHFNNYINEIKRHPNNYKPIEFYRSELIYYLNDQWTHETEVV